MQMSRGLWNGFAARWTGLGRDARAFILPLALLCTLLCATLGLGSAPASALTLSVGAAASPLTGSPQCQAGFGSPQCLYQSYDTSGNVAFAGGPAAPAVASSTIVGPNAIHDPSFINDGQYGNGRSWIGQTPNSWLKIDLGGIQLVDRITFGRDRLGGFDDRDPGQFLIDVAVFDAVYANGDDSNDAFEYTNVVDSAALGFSGFISGPETVVIDFDTPISARYIKMTIANATPFAAAIDEVQIFPVPEPSSALLTALGLIGLGARRRSSSR